MNSASPSQIDGPASLFQHTTRYGNKLAMMLPALLHVSKWRLEANLQRSQRDGELAPARFTLDADCGLVTHYPSPRQYDSLLEESLVARWPQPPRGNWSARWTWCPCPAAS